MTEDRVHAGDVDVGPTGSPPRASAKGAEVARRSCATSREVDCAGNGERIVDLLIINMRIGVAA